MRNQPNKNEPTPSIFDEISYYWMEMADADKTKEQLEFVKKYLSSKGLLLDLSCGSGRHAIPLTKAGYNLVGLDISPRLLSISKARAKEQSVSLNLIRADMRYLPFQSETFDDVFSLGSSFGYLPSEEEDAKSVHDIRRILTKSGSLVIDVFNSEHLSKRYGKKHWLTSLFFELARFSLFFDLFGCHDFPSFCLIQKRRIIANGAKLKDTWIFREKKTGRITTANHVMRLLGIISLKNLLSESGMDVTEEYGDYDESSYNQDSKRLVVVSVKK